MMVSATRVQEACICLFCLSVLLHRINLSEALNVAPHIGRSSLKFIDEQLKRLNKPAIRTIESPDGDLIDCILISQQPAFDHPFLINHTLQVQPSISAEELLDNNHDKHSTLNKIRSQHEQLWHGVGVKCPAGTIPMRRTTRTDLLRAYNTNLAANAKIHYGRKFHPPPIVAIALHNLSTKISSSSAMNSSRLQQSAVDQSGHQHAIAYVQGDKYYGAKATLNVWNPEVRARNDFSLSQLWILGGSFASNDLNSIEVGWQVSPNLYGDKNTRFFIYWTGDAYESTGCYNLLCAGFVQVSADIAVGATISPVSTYDGHQYDVSALVWKDPKTGNWWLQFGGKHLVGYWPSALFSSLAASASMVQWGGEVLVSSGGGSQMGSGHFPDEGFGRASYVSHLMVVGPSNNLHAPRSPSTYAERSECYNALSPASTNEWGDFFYFGGPGTNPNC